jgi:hypothetical protein
MLFSKVGQNKYIYQSKATFLAISFTTPTKQEHDRSHVPQAHTETHYLIERPHQATQRSSEHKLVMSSSSVKPSFGELNGLALTPDERHTAPSRIHRFRPT